MKLSAEYDSDAGELVLAKASAMLARGFAKLKASCQASFDGRVRYPLLTIETPHASVDVDVHSRNALLSAAGSAFDNEEGADGIAWSLQHDVQERQTAAVLRTDREFKGVPIAVETRLVSRPGKFFPTLVAEAAVSCEAGELRYVGRRADPESSRGIDGDDSEVHLEDESGLSGFAQMKLGKEGERGSLMASFSQPAQTVDLRYKLKNNAITLIPTLSVFPDRNLRLTFKHRLNCTHKLSLAYDLGDVGVSSVYKCTPHKHLKAKLGYDSKASLAWASLWLGNEAEGASSAPGKAKAQLMLQLPLRTEEDDGGAPGSSSGLGAPILMLRVKKRVDISLPFLSL